MIRLASTHNRLLPALLFAGLVLPAAAAAQVKTPAPPGAPLALVLSAEGDVRNGETAVSGGSILGEGSEVALANGAQVRFSLITSCTEAVVEGPGSLALREGIVALDGARLVQSEPAPGCVKADRVVLSTASQLSSGAVVVRGSNRGRLAPRAGVVTATRRRLVWDGPLADGRKVLLTFVRAEAPDEFLLEREVTGGSFEVPADVALVPGGDYAWSVEPAGLQPGPSLAGSFQVAPDAISSQLQTLRSRATDAAGWLRVAFFCEVHRLETDAGEAYAQAVARDPGAEGARQRIAELDLP